VVFQGDPDDAYRVWTQLNATEWKHLPSSGGLLDQPEALWNDVLAVEFMHRRVKESKDE
jgi:hypothetical protein